MILKSKVRCENDPNLKVKTEFILTEEGKGLLCSLGDNKGNRPENVCVTTKQPKPERTNQLI